MIKKILLAGVWALGMTAIAMADAVTPGELRSLRADGSQIDGKAAFAGDLYTFDGQSLLALPWKHAGAQTLRLQIKYAATPTGALLSKNRPEEGNRGLEIGLGSKNFFEFDGSRPAGQLSDGVKANIVPLQEAKAPELQSGVWYDIFVRFSPNDELALYVFDADAKKLVYQKSVNCGKIAEIKGSAGDGLLCFGGRRNSSKSCTFLAPAKTVIRLPEVWKSALVEEDIYRLANVNSDPAAAVAVNPAPKQYFVAVDGADTNDGLTAKTPFATIQKAADLVKPGDEVIVASGVYFEQVSINVAGTPGQPITFRAAAEGLNKVVITGADRAVRQKQKTWRLEDQTLGLYSIECDHRPARVLYDQIDLFPYPELDQLKTFTLRDGYPGVENGFYFDAAANRLFVRLHAGNRYGSGNPADRTVSIAPVAAPGYNGHHIYRPEDSNFFIGLKQPAYIIIDGFTFETPGSAGVVTGGSNVVVRNSYFKGCRFGVCGFGGPSGVFVENNVYDQAYAYSDVIDVVRKFRGSDIQKKHFFYFWARKGLNNDSNKMKNYETGIVGGVGAYWHVRNNLVVEAFEGMSSWGVDLAQHFQVYGNVFRRVVDNAVETENHTADVRIYNNHFNDVFEPVSWQPLGGLPWPGPVFVYRNLFADSPDFKEFAVSLDPAQFLPGAFKIGASGRNWEQEHMGNVPPEVLQSKISKRVVTVPEPGFLIFNNTVLRTEGYLVTAPMPITGKAIREIANVKFFNNIIQTKGLNKISDWDGGLFEFYNNLVIAGTPEVPGAKVMAGIDGKIVNTADEAPAAGKNLGTLLFDEPDAAVAAGAGELQFAAGPLGRTAAGSEFRRKLAYEPMLIRTAGLTPDAWGYYLAEGEYKLKLTNPGKVSAVTLIFRATESAGEWRVLKSGRFSLILEIKKGVTVVRVTGASGEVKTELGGLPREVWQTLELDFANGKMRCGDKVFPLALPSVEGALAFEATVGRNPVLDIAIR